MKNKIIIIENEQELSEMTASFLTRQGFEVLSLSSAENIISIIKKEQPKVVLIDLILETENGLEICHKIKGNSESANLPVIITTGYPHMEEVLENHKDLISPDKIIRKPFEIDELLKSIKELIR